MGVLIHLSRLCCCYLVFPVWSLISGHSLSPELHSHGCFHYPPPADQVIHDVDIEPEHVIKRRSADQRLRIHLHYDGSLQRIPYAHKKLIEEKVNEAVHFWESTLMVRATGAAIKLNRQCSTQGVRYSQQNRYCVGGCAPTTMCGDIQIPEQHLERCFIWDPVYNTYGTSALNNPGVPNTDFILYVAALPSERCKWEKTIAYAAHCQLEKVYDRPVAGYFSICPESISTSREDQKQLLSTIKHEILHALGFTAGLYAFYRDSNGQPLTDRNPLNNKPTYDTQSGLYLWSTNVVRQFIRTDWKVQGGTMNKKVNMMVTPKVVEEVRKHFNCPTLEGAELEDQGIDGTAFTHWEKRVFENEAMTGTYTQNPVISRITLALMEDTGWYRVRYENADEFDWGKNLGCDFVKKSCFEWIYTRQNRNEDIHPFCSNVKHGRLITDCTNNHNSVAICNLVEFRDPLPRQYQYFSRVYGVPADEVGRYGGSVALADYCPYLQEFTWKSKNIVVRGSRCVAPENELVPELNYFGERYGYTSKCFNHGEMWTLQHCTSVIHPQHSGSGCYEYQCTSQTGLTVFVAHKPYRCYKTGQKIPIIYKSNDFLHKGSIICPSCQEICQKSGIVCPLEREPPPRPHRAATYSQVPCSDSRSVIHRSNIITWTSVFSNIIGLLILLLCHGVR